MYMPGPVWVAGEILKKYGSIMIKVKVMNGMIWRRHVNQVHIREHLSLQNPRKTWT